MTEWRAARFGDVARLEYGKALKEDARTGGSFPVLGSSGVVGWHSEPLVDGPVIVVGRKGNAGAVHWVETDCWPIDTTFWVRIVDEGVEPAFLVHWLQHADLPTLQQPGARPGLGRDRVHELHISVPPLDAQRAIARTLSSAAAVEEACEGHIVRIGGLRSAYRRTALLEVASLPKPVRDIGTFARGGSFPREEQGLSSGDHPVFKVADMNTPGNERWLIQPENWVTEEQRVRLKMKLWPAGTVVFARVGAAINAERRRLLAMPSILDDNILGITPDGALLDPYFLMLALEEKRLAALAQPGAVPSVNAGIIGALEVPVPPRAMQRDIVAKVEALDRAAEQTSASLAESRALVRSLRGRLLTPAAETTSRPSEPIGAAA